MFKIVKKEILNPTTTLMEVVAPYVARKAEAGQFIIL
jgi:ferredoxin--NADP+ reductase